MTTEFKLPELGENIETGDVVKILVSVGEVIEPDQPVLELETDKATVEVPSSVSGKIQAIHISEGDTVQVGQVILTTESNEQASGAPAPELEKPGPASPPAEVESPPPDETPAQATAPATRPAEFKLPDLGENIESGAVVSILVSVGDTIEPDQPVLELETDKATVEVPSSVSGKIQAIHISEGDTVQVGQLVLTVEGAAAPDQTRPAPPPKPTEAAPAAKVEPKPAAAPPPPESKPAPATVATPPAQAPPGPRVAVEPGSALGVIPAAPNVRRLAREIGVDIVQVPGTGPDGRISIADVKNYARQRTTTGVVAAPTRLPTAEPLPDFSKWGEIEPATMSNIRRKTAEHLSYAWTAIPHVTQFGQADITELEQLRKRFGKTVEAAGARLTVTAILLKLVVSALKSFPQFNASIDMAKSEIIYKKYYHIGVAVDTDRGLLVPVIRDVDQKNIIELAVELNRIAEKTRDRKLKLEDMQGGTFTITNLGGIGGTNFTPIVNSPEVAILGVSRSRVEPVYQNGQFEPRTIMPLSLSYDHRVIDGADGARFLKAVVEHLEQPFLTALQGW